MSGSEGLLWIVYAGDEPVTAHLSLDAAKAAAQWTLERDNSGAAYSIWSARLTHSADPGIPIYRTEQGPTETFEVAERGEKNE